MLVCITGTIVSGITLSLVNITLFFCLRASSVKEKEIDDINYRDETVQVTMERRDKTEKECTMKMYFSILPLL